MKNSINLYFTNNGLYNKNNFNYITQENTTQVVLFNNGSEESLEAMAKFNLRDYIDFNPVIKIAKLPLYEMRVIGQGGEISNPNYVYNEVDRIKWICSKICSSHIKISMSDMKSTNGTQVTLNKQQTETMCFAAYNLWMLIKSMEDRLLFPAVLIDSLMRFTYMLTPQTMDIEKLRKESGVSSLNYNNKNDTLSVCVGDDIFTVKMSILNDIYGEVILPFYRSINGRNIRLNVTVKGLPHHNVSPVDMSYYFLGHTVESMRLGCVERNITSLSPIELSDLVLFSKKVKLDDETSITVTDGETINSIITKHKNYLTRRNEPNNNSYKINANNNEQEFLFDW